MKFIYQGTTYEYDEDRLAFGEAKAFEKKAGASIPALQQHRAERDSQVMQAMLWSAMKRHEPTLKYEDLEQMTYADFEFLPDGLPLGERVGDLLNEVGKFMEGLGREPGITDEVGEAFAVACTTFAEQLTAALPADDTTGVPSGPPDPPAAVEQPATTPTANDDEKPLSDSTGSG